MSIHHPLEFSWHPFEGAGRWIFVLRVSLLLPFKKGRHDPTFSTVFLPGFLSLDQDVGAFHWPGDEESSRRTQVEGIVLWVVMFAI